MLERLEADEPKVQLVVETSGLHFKQLIYGLLSCASKQ